LSHPGPLEVVTHFNTAWEAGDLEGALAFVAEDAVYELHVSNDALPFGGQTMGRVAIKETMRRMRADWEYILYRPLALAGHGDIVRFQVEFMYRHRASGEILSGRFRLVMRIENGLIKRADEYHDRAKVEAFMRLVGGSEQH
jgi:ketosteroid isomerase-like protein